MAQAGDEGDGFPFSLRNMTDQPLAARAAAQQRGIGPAATVPVGRASVYIVRGVTPSEFALTGGAALVTVH